MMDNEPVSPLPEKFEEFDKVMKKRSAPASKPKVAPKKKLTAADIPGVGGMVEKRWSGIPMWECPRCLATTFKAVEAKVHQCNKVRYADEAD